MEETRDISGDVANGILKAALVVLLVAMCLGVGAYGVYTWMNQPQGEYVPDWNGQGS